MGGYTKQVKEVLSQNGCRFDRQSKGDHEYWYSPISGRKFPVDSDIKSRHTANGIMKQAGLSHRFR